MTTLSLRIPDDLEFSALELKRDPDGAVSFRWDVIERLCVDSGIDPAIFKDGPEDNVSQLIVAWYREHLARGGARDAVQDDLIAEAADEDDFGAGLSYEPGRA